VSDAERTAWQVRGNPTDAELAAVVAVLAAAAASAGGGTEPTAADEGGWSAYWRGLRPVVAPGPGSWRASGWPR
jgi:hypothetical protein